MGENRRLEQINLSAVGIIIIILVLFHSIYLLISEKKQILGLDSLTNEEFITQALGNRIISFLVILLFFSFSLENYNNAEDKTNTDLLRLLVSTFSLIAILIELYLTIKNYIAVKEEENNSN